MQSEQKWPPSGRDFEVYRRVAVESASTRQAAAEFSLSQTRVRQVVKRVAEWLLEELPVAGEEADAAHLRLGLHVAADRLDVLLCEAMTGWRKSHETKYFGMALRVITLQSKMPVIAGTVEALMADAIEGPLPDETRLAPAKPSAAPPVRDCSHETASSPAASPAEPQSSALVPTPATTSAAAAEPARAARREFFGPAQQPTAAAVSEPVTELTITPERPGIQITPPLSRRERRRLARMSA